MIGVNLAGAESGPSPGIYGTDYVYPGEADLDYFNGQGVKLVRLPVVWERLQPVVGGEIDIAELARVREFLNLAGSRGMTVILDLHSFGRFDGVPIGSPEVPIASFAGLWSRLATELAGSPGLGGYGLMNEPHDMGAPQVWPAAAQAAVDAIRAVDVKAQILVGGDNWGGAHSWPYNNAELAIQDPASNLAYEAHLFFDRDNSGTYRGSYEEEGGYPMLAVDRFLTFVDWLDANEAKGFIGEFGAPDDDPRWASVLENLVEALHRSGVPGAYWLAGSGSTGNPLSVQPTDGADSPFMEILSRFASLPTPATFNDVLKGGAADDEILGYAGDDRISGGAGRDRLHGNIGRDHLVGGEGGDTLLGGRGNDVQIGQNGDDLVDGGGGDDQLRGDAGEDTIEGRDGNDRLMGGAGADDLWGDQGADLLLGGNDDDWLDGGLERDRLFGENGADRLEGRDGADLLDGGAGGDELNGEAGNDTLKGQGENDLLSGQSGDDGLYGGLGDDTLQGGEGRDRVFGQDGQDALYGEGGNDTLLGGGGNDWIEGQESNDLLYGEAGSDRFVFGPGAGRDVIADFDVGAGDRLDFEGQTFTSRDVATGLQLTLSGGGTVVLTGLRGAEADPDWFV